jgi:RimJ/RimL family protein N-acetyltransferase
MNHLSFPKILGKLVSLRELSMDDATAIANLMGYNISKYLYEVTYPYKIDDALNFIKSSYNNFRLHKSITFAIDYKNNRHKSIQLLAGTISIKDIDYINQKANIGYWIGKQYQGKGIATECVKLIVNYTFYELDLQEITAYVFPENKPSIRVLEKNGFVKVGKVNEYHSISNRYRDSLIYIKNME